MGRTLLGRLTAAYTVTHPSGLTCDLPARSFISPRCPLFPGLGLRAQCTERRGVRLEYSEKYHEEKPFPKMSKGERAVHLYRALEFGQSNATMDLRFRGHFFRDPVGKTVFVYAAATPPNELAVREAGPNREVLYSIAAKAVPVAAGAPVYRELARTETFDGAQFKAALANPHAYVQADGVVAIPPGDYTWRIAWRDDETGRYGRFETPLDVPDLTTPASVSSLLVTRRVEPLEAGAEPGLLDFGGRRFEAETPREYRAGDTVYALFDLYEAPDEWLGEPPPLKFALLLEEQPIEHRAVSEVFVAESTRSIRYLATLDTAEFLPGMYTAFALMPDAENRPDPYIYATFQIVR